MFSDKRLMRHAVFAFLAASSLAIPLDVYSMGGKPESNTPQASIKSIDNAPISHITLKELANIYWADSNSTQLQQEETLKNLLGKKVNWDITVAQIQRDGNYYIIQGQSDKEMLGTFSYVAPKTEAEKEEILKATMGAKLNVTGIVNEMQMRHIVLKPANITVKDK